MHGTNFPDALFNPETGRSEVPGLDQKRLNRRAFLRAAGLVAGTVAFSGMLGKFTSNAYAACGTGTVTLKTLDPLTIPKFVSQLIIPPAYVPDADGIFRVDAALFTEQILPLKDADGKSTGFGLTTVFAYGGKVKDTLTGDSTDFRFSPGATFEVIRGIPTQVEWTNNLTGAQFLPVDPTLHWANPNGIPKPTPPFTSFPPGYEDAQSPIPIVTHLHGGEVSSFSDGGPDAWFTASGITGPAFTSRLYDYINEQQATTMFYHDHALGMTRLNLYAGLAGFYLIRDLDDNIAPLLPKGKYFVPLAIQDRMFFESDSCGHNDLAFPYVGVNPDIHPYWAPEFFGDTVMVNGQVWPNLDVDKGQYLFDLLNGSNARFYTLTLSNGLSFVQIGTDGGYLQKAVTLTELTIAPGERAQILVDFSDVASGTKIILKNSAAAPFPAGDAANPDTIGQIIQFTVGSKSGFTPKTLPTYLNKTLAGPSWPQLGSPSKERILTLNEQLSAAGNPIALFLNGQMWDATITETPVVGTTEEWKFVNLTGDTHPMHLHLTQFQLASRQAFNADKYLTDWLALNKDGLTDGQLPFKMDWATKVLPVDSYLTGDPIPAPDNERGWKDVVRSNPGEITTIRVRWAQQNGEPYGFDATEGPGYVWHCHIVDHEDNEMMRPLILKNGDSKSSSDSSNMTNIDNGSNSHSLQH